MPSTDVSNIKVSAPPMKVEPEKRYGHPDFYKLLDEIAQIHNDKNHDYATREDPLSNFRACERIGLPAWKGAIVRMMDKWDRIVNLTRGEEAKVKSESIVDTLKDLSVYCLLAVILYEETQKK